MINSQGNPQSFSRYSLTESFSRDSVASDDESRASVSSINTDSLLEEVPGARDSNLYLHRVTPTNATYPDSVFSKTEEKSRRSSSKSTGNASRLNCTRIRKIPHQVVDEASDVPLSSFATIAATLRFRSHMTPKATVLSAVDSRGKHHSISFARLNSKAQRIAQMLQERSGKATRVVLLFSRQELLEYSAALFGVFYARMVAVAIVPCPDSDTDQIDQLEAILAETKPEIVLTTDSTMRYFSKRYASKENASLPKDLEWVKTSELGNYKPHKAQTEDVIKVNKDDTAYIEYTKGSDGNLRAVTIDHRTILSQCASAKVTNELSATDVALSVLEPRQQFGLMAGIFLAVYNGHHLIYASGAVCRIPGLWQKLIHRNQVTITLNDYPSLVDIIASSADYYSQHPPESSQAKEAGLASIKTLLVDSVTIYESFHNEVYRFLGPYGLNYDAILPVAALNDFGGLVLAWKDRSEQTSQERLSLLLNRASMRENCVEIVGHTWDKSDDTVTILGLPPNVMSSSPLWISSETGFVNYQLQVAIVDSENFAISKKDEIGEIWVHGESLPTEFFAKPESLSQEYLKARFTYTEKGKTKRAKKKFLRTGLYGYLFWGTQSTDLNTPRLFVTGRKEWRALQRKKDERISMEERKDLLYNTMELEASRALTETDNSFNTHFVNQIEQNILVNVPSITRSCIFSAYINSENLPVILIESDLKKTLEIVSTLRQIKDLSILFNAVRFFCIAVVETNTLPRYKMTDANKDEADMMTAFSGYSGGIVTKLWREEGQTLTRKSPDTAAEVTHSLIDSKIPVIVSQKARDLFFQGLLPVRRLYMNVGSDVVANVPQVYQKELSTVGDQIWGFSEPTKILDYANQNGEPLIDLAKDFPTIVHVLLWRIESSSSEKDMFTEMDFRNREVSSNTYQKFGKKIMRYVSSSSNKSW